MKASKKNEPRMMDAPEVAVMIGRSIASLYRDMRLGRFPKPEKPYFHVARWREDDVRAWMKARKQKAAA